MIAIYLLIFIFGLLIGSFLNVVIYRLPREMSVVRPRSSCTNCGKQIKWYQNIPVFSYLILRGKCGECDVKIGIKYPLVELLVGIFALLLFPFDIPILNITHLDLFKFIVEFSIACVFLAHFIIDIEHQLLPDKLNLYLLAVVAPYAFLSFPPHYWVIGGLVGFLGPYLVTLLFLKLRGVVGLGGGDIKLFGILGILLGPVGVINTIFMSSLAGSVIGLLLIATKKMNKDTALAFGPYILVVAAVQIFFPEVFELINPFGFN
ncbi:MAG: prepilin peptidase [Bacteriovoracaceae bacterium]|nr:prepilin peptidase [Bacteriovoracaceae bacterium]